MDSCSCGWGAGVLWQPRQKKKSKSPTAEKRIFLLKMSPAQAGLRRPQHYRKGLGYKTEMPLPGPIAAALLAGDTVIASSARAARALRREYAEAQRSKGLEAWQSPDILDWDSWLNRLWQQRVRSGNE